MRGPRTEGPGTHQGRCPRSDAHGAQGPQRQVVQDTFPQGPKMHPEELQWLRSEQELGPASWFGSQRCPWITGFLISKVGVTVPVEGTGA